MDKYEVLEVEGTSGLTLGPRVLAPGKVFSETDWPYGEKALLAAIENKRCKKVIEEKKPDGKGTKVEVAEPADRHESTMTKAQRKAAEEKAAEEAKKAKEKSEADKDNK